MMRLHVLGIGSVGTLLAHHLRLANPNTPISLVFRNAAAFSKKRFRKDGVNRPTLKVTRTEGDTLMTDGFDVDVAMSGKLPALVEAAEQDGMDFVNAGGPIDSLIVCTKTQATAEAIEGLHSRLSSSSVITLLQNGMGVYDELCAKFWPDPVTRPNFVLGTTTHGIAPAGETGSVLHMSPPGQGAIKWGVVPDPRKQIDFETWLWGRPVGDLPTLTPPESPSLPLRTPPDGPGTENLHATLEALLSITPLSPTLLPMPTLYNELLIKLALNAAINPLTAVLGGGYLQNGSLSRSAPGHRLVQQVTKESSQVLTAYMHNLFAPHPAPADTVRLFSYESLLHRVQSVITATKGNTSSMANDVKNGRMTEIDYINGHLASLGHRLGVQTPVNRMLVQMVKFKAEVGGLGGTVYPRVRQTVREAEEEALEARRLSLEERKVSLQERAMLLKEERTAEAKRAKREWKRTVRRNAAVARNLRAAEVEAAIRGGADPTEVLRATEAEASEASGSGNSEWTSASSDEGEGSSRRR
ncbi:2-dehydropantoate 2-reductase [Cutaneotrichosporon oleaginosum]|uniref:2-dehydropantoate 2-reductase n=1 Tax=Cutaneotrichosporon oleaginosum TaxID=879819 RepID=A0A0J0XZL3_9TREE|nr:2-dehydropantoate 2-reductase [Cutaneotrichosporon oleaginosum]KLT46478.1 2-dehydropantoate 2-reductase [Cutaneotrichosporon oleaginosum]TXT15155.1 hypothetical protein COLE_01348 [Cutaneotrichosporon oleaginosum]